jgi:hypothetical protein
MLACLHLSTYLGLYCFSFSQTASHFLPSAGLRLCSAYLCLQNSWVTMLGLLPGVVSGYPFLPRLSSNYHPPISVSWVAGIIGMSLYSFALVFKDSI